MSDTDIPRKRARTSVLNECRACLVKIQDGLGCVDIFRAWDPSWSGMGASIALDLVKLSNIQISASDPHSKNICKTCCTRLQEALHFTLSVQKNDLILRKRHKESKDENPLWPKPIQVDKNITTNELNVMTAEVKEEVLTEDEYEMNETCNEASEPNLDIKIEPEELTPVAISCDAIKVDGPLSDPDPAAGKTANANSATEAPVEHLVEGVKEEPMSEDESEPVADMPKDCMLCLESFNTVKGLKAHVIAVHSYKSFASPRVEKLNVCTKCNRSFTTRAELSMHEVCHNNFKCYVCHKKLDTFLLLIEHRDKCEQEQNLSELETLEDVRRIARYRGTNSIRLFDLHIPIAQIREMKINKDEFRKIMMAKRKKTQNKEEHTKRGKNGKRNKNDPFQNIFNDNVMSVVVNLRMPLDEDLKPKIEPLGDFCSEIPPAELGDDKTSVKRHNIASIIPKTELDCKDYLQMRVRRKKRRSKVTLGQRTLVANPILKIPDPNIITPSQSFQNHNETCKIKIENVNDPDDNYLFKEDIKRIHENEQWEGDGEKEATNSIRKSRRLKSKEKQLQAIENWRMCYVDEAFNTTRKPLYFVSDKISSKISEEGQTPESHNDLISKVTGGKEAPNSVGTRSALEPQDLGNYEIIEEDIPLELSVSGHSTVNEKPTIEELTSKLNVISEGSHESNKATEKEPENMSYSKERNSNSNKNLDTFKPEENTQSSQKPVYIDTAVIVDFKSQQAEDIKQEEYVDVAQDDELTLESNSSNNNIDDDKSEVCYKIRENGSEVSNITKEYEVKDNNNQKENESEAEIKICVVIDSINHIKSEERRISEDSKLTLELPLKIEENLVESTTIDNITSKSSNIGPEVCKTKGSITATLETILNQDLENKREENLLQSLENANIKNETDEQTDMNDMKQSPSNKDLKSLLSEMQVDNLESMKIELEIHSMDKDTMEIDGDLENGIKASSESDKQT